MQDKQDTEKIRACKTQLDVRNYDTAVSHRYKVSGADFYFHKDSKRYKVFTLTLFIYHLIFS